MKSVILSGIKSMVAAAGLSSSSYGYRVKPRARFYGQSPEAKASAINKANVKRERRNNLRDFNTWESQVLKNPMQRRFIGCDPASGQDVTGEISLKHGVIDCWEGRPSREVA